MGWRSSKPGSMTCRSFERSPEPLTRGTGVGLERRVSVNPLGSLGGNPERRGRPSLQAGAQWA